MATKTQRKKTIIARRKLAETKEGDRRKANIETLQAHIDLGEVLAETKKEDWFTPEWLVKECVVDYKQSFKLIRIAKHKVQALAIAQNDGIADINQLQKLLPKTADDVEEVEADLPADARAQKKARNSNDWHTPEEYVRAVTEVLGYIGLDPFSSVQANEMIGADEFFTVADDAMNKEWKADTLFMNPPYGNKKKEGTTATEAVGKFVEQWKAEAFPQAVVLMNCAADTKWFAQLWNSCTRACLTDHRIEFVDAGGKQVSGNTKGQVFFYFGEDVNKFTAVFSDFGHVIQHSERVL